MLLTFMQPSPGRESIGIGPIGINVHVRLQEDRAPLGFRMPQLQHRLAIVKIMPGKKLIEPDQVLFQVPQLRVVKFFEEWRNGIGRDH